MWCHLVSFSFSCIKFVVFVFNHYFILLSINYFSEWIYRQSPIFLLLTKKLLFRKIMQFLCGKVNKLQKSSTIQPSYLSKPSKTYQQITQTCQNYLSNYQIKEEFSSPTKSRPKLVPPSFRPNVTVLNRHTRKGWYFCC